MTIDEEICALAIKIASQPQRPPLTADQALAQLAHSSPDGSIRRLAAEMLAERDATRCAADNRKPGVGRGDE